MWAIRFLDSLILVIDLYLKFLTKNSFLSRRKCKKKVTAAALAAAAAVAAAAVVAAAAAL